MGEEPISIKIPTGLAIMIGIGFAMYFLIASFPGFFAPIWNATAFKKVIGPGNATGPGWRGQRGISIGIAALMIFVMVIAVVLAVYYSAKGKS